MEKPSNHEYESPAVIDEPDMDKADEENLMEEDKVVLTEFGTDETCKSEDDSNNEKGEKKEVTTDGSDAPSESYKDASHLYPPSSFTDNRGNLKFVNLVCRHPCKIFTVILVLCLFITLVLLRMVNQAGNPFAEPSSDYEMKDVRSTAFDSLRLARDEVNRIRGEQTESGEGVRPQQNYLDLTYWIFEGKTEDGVFGTRESVEAMKEAFDLFTSDEDYESFCMRNYETINGTTTSECITPNSPLNMYYASEWDADQAQIVIDELAQDYPSNILRYNFLGVCVEFDLFCSPFMQDEDLDWARALNDNITQISDAWDGKGELNPNVTQVTLFAAYMGELNTKRGLVDFGFDKNFNLTNQKSLFSRGMIYWGSPLENRKVSGAYNSERTDNEDALIDYISEKFLQDMNEITSKDHDPEVNSYYYMNSLLLEVIFDIAVRDGMLAIFSFIFVFIYIRISLGSWFLATVGIAEIAFSIPVSWFLFSVVLRIQYFSILNTLALFIVAAIGADDIFIFMDAYKQSATPSEKDAYILESLESRMSWVYRRTGSAMGITSATTCLAFLCTLTTPLESVKGFGIFAALVIFIDYVLVMSLFCTAVVIYHNKMETPGCCCSCCCSGGGCCKTLEPSPTAIALENLTTNGRHDEKDRISKFFATKVSGFVLNQKGRLLVVVIFSAWLIVASIFAAQLEPTEATEQFLDEGHPLQTVVTILDNEFSSAESTNGLEIFFAWGIGDVDRTGVNRLFDPDFFGTPVFLDSFEFNEECQLEMMQICDDLKTNSTYEPFIKQTDGLGTVKCFIEEFGAYSAIGSLDSCEGVTSGAWKQTDWTVPLENVDSMMESFVEETTCRGRFNTTVMTHYANELGWDGSGLRYAGISVENNVMNTFSTKAQSVAREQYDAMIKLSKEMDARMEQKCGSKVIMTDLAQQFTFMNNQSIYVQSAILSSLLGVIIAFVVLFISTRLLHIALLATLSIASVLTSVTGIMVIIGWELGTIESILISVVAGFSVDYVVHLAHSYEQGDGDTESRIRKAFGEMGISVLNGMITSVGASIPLFFCQLQFFGKFGTFLCTIIAFSWVLANFVFMSSLAQLKIPLSKNQGMCGI